MQICVPSRLLFLNVNNSIIKHQTKPNQTAVAHLGKSLGIEINRCMLLYRPGLHILSSGFSALSQYSRERKKQNKMSGSMEVMKRAAIKREEEENKSDGWEGNKAEGSRAEGSCNYTAEAKTKHRRKKG